MLQVWNLVYTVNSQNYRAAQKIISFFSQSVSLTQYVVLSVRHPVLLFQLAYCLNDQAHFAWFTLGVPRGQLGGSSGSEDDIWWKTLFDGRQPLMEDDLRRKTTFDGRRSLTEDDLWQKTQLRRRSDYCRPAAIFSDRKTFESENVLLFFKFVGAYPNFF